MGGFLIWSKLDKNLIGTYFLLELRVNFLQKSYFIFLSLLLFYKFLFEVSDEYLTQKDGAG